MSFRHLVNAANAASFGWQLSGSRTYLAAQVPALMEAPVPAFGVTSGPSRNWLGLSRLGLGWRGRRLTASRPTQLFRRRTTSDSVGKTESVISLVVRRGFGLGGLEVPGIQRPQGRGSQTGPTISQTDH